MLGNKGYKWLDNLKLGFGGTKSEMQRLLKEATKISGVKYNIDNLADVYEAVHVIQKEIGITGTTAKEAEETLTGSLSAMTASFQNLIGNIAIGNGTIKQDVIALIKTIGTFVFGNLLPMLGNIISAVPPLIIEFIKAAIPQMMNLGKNLINSIGQGFLTGIPNFIITIAESFYDIVFIITEYRSELVEQGGKLIDSIVQGVKLYLPVIVEAVKEAITIFIYTIVDYLPVIVEQGVEMISKLAKGIWDALPTIINAITDILSHVIGLIIEHFPEPVEQGIKIIGNLAKGIWDNLPHIITTIANLLFQILSKIFSHLPKFLEMGLKIIGHMAIGIIRAIPGLVGKLPQVISSILGVFARLPLLLFDIGKNLIRGLWNGIKSVGSWIRSKVSGFVSGIVGGIKSFFGIHSPSRLMKNEVGKFIPMGLAIGIEDNLKPVSRAMDEMGEIATREFNSGISFGTNLLNKAKAYASSGMVSMKDELQVEANIDVNIGGHDLTRVTQILGREKEKQDEFEYAY